MPLRSFHPSVRAWFEGRFGAPSRPQAEGWPAIARGENVLILAPTGSGKTLAAFLKCLDILYQQGDRRERGVQVLYISPLKALNNDIYRNLEVPLAEIEAKAAELGMHLPHLTHAVRTGDTPQREREEMRRHPPDILITTPESLYLLLTSRSRDMLRTVRYVIVDEIHALCTNKRGAHLSLSLERLEALLPRPPVRIGLSATQRPLDEVARYLGGTGRPVTIVDAGVRRDLDLRVEVPVADMRVLPESSLWPAIHQRVLDLVAEHRATIVFVGSRGLAERLTGQLNARAGREVARVHHGSLSREAREQVEAELKAGRLPCLVATSSLELGIDVGTVDLVIQIESPHTVSRGLQRVGRAGHAPGAVSKGRLLPKYRGDLLEMAGIVREMRRGEVEEIRVPTGALDVLAQQVVAMAAVDEWRVDDLLALVRRAYGYRDLTERQLHGVLEMLSGRYPSEEFRELRPRIVWDREAGVIRAREGARALAALSGGTIPDRGYYAVYLEGSDVKLGEMDEEFVYESRVGDVFLLGTSTWQIRAIEHDRVVAAPAPGRMPRMPFWKGEGTGRPLALGRRLGAFAGEVAARLDDPSLPAWLQGECCLDQPAAQNLIQYLRDQVAHTGAVPTDRRVVLERFPDELGDQRLVLLSPFGGRVNTAWGMVLRARIRQLLRLEAEVTTSDDVIHIRLPAADRQVDPDALLRLDPDEAVELLLDEVSATPLFGAHFRMNAGRALVLPRPRPGRRRPFWLQRMKAADLLQVARRYPDFPLVLETYREVLRDVLDLDGLRQVLEELASGEIALAVAETDSPSPMASQILLQFVAENFYEGEAPRAERQGALLTLNRELLDEILGTGALRDLLDPEAIAVVTARLRGQAEGWRPRHPDDVEDLLRRAGDMTGPELAACGVEPAWLDRLAAEGRAVRLPPSGEDSGSPPIPSAARWAAADDAALYLRPEADVAAVVRRYARSHGPFRPEEVAGRYGLSVQAVTEAAEVLAARGELAAGEFTRGVAGREYCDRSVLRQIRRQTLTLLRAQVEPVDAAAYARFLLAWHGLAPRARHGASPHAAPLRTLMEVLRRLQGYPLPAELWEREVLPRRVPGYQPLWLDQLLASGELHWVGAPGGRLAFYLPEQAGLLAGQLAAPAPDALTPEQAQVLAACRSAGAEFLGGIARRAGLSPSAALEALWDLVWMGLVTNDTFAPVREVLRSARTAASRGRSAPVLRGGTGRWWLTSSLAERMVAGPDGPAAAGMPAGRAAAYAELLLERYGVVTREAVAADEGSVPWGEVLAQLRRMEWRGQVRQGYFVAGLSGVQFARADAVERLRQAREQASASPLLLPAADPANPYGSVLPWPGETRLARLSSNYVVVAAGRPVLGVEGHGRRLLPLAPLEGDALREALAALPDLLRAPAHARAVRRIEVRQWEDAPVQQSPAAEPLRALGFEPTPRGLVYYG
ncbi:ATP-dependent Lhr-like helicase [Symbiobacterium terraclitae]|uniref:ATP-dependent Lhr-like helicase n=1 Tax=Symbiobacterium terraclitae TaxID=557451 RepID=A0ABS4JTC1_9FIRM|nr:DEAD/DEAH box helicase [Symbiobacterium terraclitae]MBP2018778.1 ATP-dependent Lhr-like helicase [Symbiobacterium terraclitae]